MMLTLVCALLSLVTGALVMYVVMHRRVVTHQQHANAQTVELARFAERLHAGNEQASVLRTLLQTATESLPAQFRSTASEVLEEKTRRLADDNQTQLALVLAPVQTQLAGFQQKLEHLHGQNTREFVSIGTQFKQFQETTRTLGEHTIGLTRALTGSNKVQGNWGETMLAKLLETAGLRKDHEYVIQQSFTRDDGSRGQPDVIVQLPEGKTLAIDAKVSLVAFARYAQAENDAGQTIALKDLRESLRTHIKNLGDKRYQDLAARGTGYVFLFVPIEAAFITALGHDPELIQFAAQRNVFVTSPSTLLPTLQMIANQWRQADQEKNSREIAKQGAALYEKFVGFVEEFRNVGARLEQAQTAYGSALGKLAQGRGNLVGQAEKLKSLGVTPSKSLPPALLEMHTDENILDVA